MGGVNKKVQYFLLLGAIIALSTIGILGWSETHGTPEIVDIIALIVWLGGQIGLFYGLIKPKEWKLALLLAAAFSIEFLGALNLLGWTLFPILYHGVPFFSREHLMGGLRTFLISFLLAMACAAVAWGLDHLKQRKTLQ